MGESVVWEIAREHPDWPFDTLYSNPVILPSFLDPSPEEPRGTTLIRRHEPSYYS